MDNESEQMKVIVVDDEPLARRGLCVRLKEYDDVDIIDECSTGREAVESIRQHRPDVVFLDIQMPELNGFEVVKTLQSQMQTLPIILFVTAYDDYAVKAFDIHALDYLLKPADSQRIGEALERVRNALSHKKTANHSEQLLAAVSDLTGQTNNDILTKLDNKEPIQTNPYDEILAIKDGSEVTRVQVKNILWIDAAGDYMCVHSTEGMHIMRMTMKKLEQLLDPNQFIRVHRSAIVNVNFIKKMVSHVSGEYHLILHNDTELKVSRSHRDKVKSMMKI